jgi:phage gp46-like protein
MTRGMRARDRAHMPWIDQGLTFNAQLQRCSLAFNGVDLQIDATPVTPILIAVGCNRRAHSDDTLPDTVTNAYTPSRLNARGGWCGDALDLLGRLIGSRAWLFQVGKQNEATRKGMEGALSEAFAPISKQRGWPITITVWWVRRGFLGCLTKVGNATLNLILPAGS